MFRRHLCLISFNNFRDIDKGRKAVAAAGLIANDKMTIFIDFNQQHKVKLRTSDDSIFEAVNDFTHLAPLVSSSASDTKKTSCNSLRNIWSSSVSRCFKVRLS